MKVYESNVLKSLLGYSVKGMKFSSDPDFVPSFDQEYDLLYEGFKLGKKKDCVKHLKISDAQKFRSFKAKPLQELLVKAPPNSIELILTHTRKDSVRRRAKLMATPDEKHALKELIVSAGSRHVLVISNGRAPISIEQIANTLGVNASECRLAPRKEIAKLKLDVNSLPVTVSEYSDAITEILVYERIFSLPNRIVMASGLPTVCAEMWPHDFKQLLASLKCKVTYLTSPETRVGFVWKHGGKNVSLAGSFNSWTPTLMHLNPDTNRFELSLSLHNFMVYEYKFVVDGNWYYDMEAPHRSDGNGNVNNYIFL